jgi:hypothetical protein
LHAGRVGGWFGHGRVSWNMDTLGSFLEDAGATRSCQIDAGHALRQLSLVVLLHHTNCYHIRLLSPVSLSGLACRMDQWRYCRPYSPPSITL